VFSYVVAVVFVKAVAHSISDIGWIMASSTTGTGGNPSIFDKGLVKLGMGILKSHRDNPTTWVPPRKFELPSFGSWRIQ